MINLDWALAHMDTIKSKRVRKKKGTAEEWVYEAEVKDSKEDVSTFPRPWLDGILMFAES